LYDDTETADGVTDGDVVSGLYWDQSAVKVQQIGHPKNEFLKDLEIEEEEILNAQATAQSM